MSFSSGCPILLIDERDRQYLFNIPAADESALKLRGEIIKTQTLLDQYSGSVLRTEMGLRYLVLEPSLDQVIMNMPRQAQVIYPKDIALMLMYGDIRPGLNIVEIGCGHGALTMSLLRALGGQGSLITYDIRRDHLNKTRKNIILYLGNTYLESWQAVCKDLSQVACEEQAELPGKGKVERLFSDIPEPWTMLDIAAWLVPEGGIWISYVPTVLQLMQQVSLLNRHPAWSMAEGFETLQRYWHVRPPSVRPKHGMKAHTGFIISARRKQRAQITIKTLEEKV